MEKISAINFLDPLLRYIDSGRFFREPFRWLYLLFGVLNLFAPIVLIASVTDYWDYLSGGSKFAFFLILIIVVIGAWASFVFWLRRKDSLKEFSTDGSEFVVIPVMSHFTQTCGEWLGLYFGVVGTLVSIVVTLFGASELGNSFPTSLGGTMIVLCPVYGFLIAVFARLLAEVYRALAAIANNTKHLSKPIADAPQSPCEETENPLGNDKI